MDIESSYFKADKRAQKKSSFLAKTKSKKVGPTVHDQPEYSRDTYLHKNIPSMPIAIGYIASIQFINEQKQFLLWNKDLAIQENAILHRDIPKQLGQQLLIGDAVQYYTQGDQNVIFQRVPRINTLTRLKGERAGSSGPRSKKLGIVANIDIGIIVAAAINPSFHANFIDRYAILLQYSGIKPLICITKSDLYELKDPLLERYQNSLGIDVVYCSVQTGQGMEELKSKIVGKTTVLLGNSGVGKSSLTNALVANNQAKTQEVSIKSGQGKHTTTSSTWYNWAKDSFIIDTPGIRSLELLEIKKEDLKDYFQDFVALSPGCQYKDCTHTHEPICAIKKAVSEKSLSPHRYENYLRIREKLY